MKYIVTGGAGFIGSNLVDRLLETGHEVVVFDNMSTGSLKFLSHHGASAKVTVVTGDITDPEALRAAMQGVEFVVHFAANADVRFGLQHPKKDLEINTIGTFNVLEAMRACGVSKIAFASTSALYGENPMIPTPEDAPFPVQTSLYAASKLAGEGLITSYCEGFGFQAWIFRFASILGARYSHGHVYDFTQQLLQHPEFLTVLGDGRQIKCYMDVSDCVTAILWAVAHAGEKVNIFNIGNGETCTVRDSIGWICEALGLTPEIRYGGGRQGWIGDNPIINLDVTKIKATGWQPHFKLQQSVARTVEWLLANRWIFEERH